MDAFLASMTFFAAALILSIIFCFQSHKDIFWMISVALFSFGTVLCDDRIVMVFVAVLSAIILILLGHKSVLAYWIAVIFAYLAVYNTRDLYLFNFTLVMAVSVILLVYSTIKSNLELPAQQERVPR